MNISSERCWQIAAGDTDRNYAEICLKHNVVIMGPGYCGDWLRVGENGESLAKENLLKRGITSRKISTIERFVSSVMPGDLVVLRIGRSEVHGVGVVLSEYQYNELFADVDGWNLSHVHQVNWIWAKPDGTPKFFKDALNFGDTTQKIEPSNKKTKELFDWVNTLPEPDHVEVVPLQLPGASIKPRDISNKLFDYGMASGSLSSLEDQIRDLGSLALWYKNYCKSPSESETVAHLVVPLLLSLGWTPQRISLEYYQKGVGRADLALFANGNRSDYEPVAMIEAKKFGNSCLTAEEQVRKYAEGMSYVRRLVVTDGIRYGIFVREDNNPFPVTPNAYLNLTDLRDNYPVYGDCAGADESMLFLSAAWSHRFLHPSNPSV